MACSESDQKCSIEFEIFQIQKELEHVSNERYDISLREKMLRHKLYDLEYQLRNCSDSNS